MIWFLGFVAIVLVLIGAVAMDNLEAKLNDRHRAEDNESII